jgi:hypothetical protein
MNFNLRDVLIRTGEKWRLCAVLSAGKLYGESLTSNRQLPNRNSDIYQQTPRNRRFYVLFLQILQLSGVNRRIDAQGKITLTRPLVTFFNLKKDKQILLEFTYVRHTYVNFLPTISFGALCFVLQGFSFFKSSPIVFSVPDVVLI